MGKAAIVTKPVQQVLKALPVDKLAPDLYRLITGDANLNNIKTRSKAHPGAFSADMGGIINSGKLKTYVDDLPPAWKSDYTNHFNSLDTDGQADFSDLIIRGAGEESEALGSLKQAADTLQLERVGNVRKNKLQNLNNQPVETAKPKQIRAQSTERMDSLNAQILGEEQWDPMRQAGREDKGLKEDLIDGKGQNIHTAQRTQGLAPHHLSEKAFDEKAIRDWPEPEQLQYIRDMNSIDLYPGNHPKNWIGLFHDNNLGLLLQQKKAVNDLRIQAGKAGIIDEATGKPYAPLSKRELDDWYKADAHVSDKVNPEYGKAELQSADPEIRSEARDELMAGPIKRDWSQILPPGNTIKDIKAIPPIISRDHQEFVHGIINRLPSTKRIKELQATNQWNSLPYTERIRLLMTNGVEKQNVAFNVSLIRINKIRKAIGKPNASFDDILVFMKNNPQRAAMIGWHEEVARGGDLLNQIGKTVEEITADLKPKDKALVSQVFGMAEIPNSSVKLQQWLKANGY